MQMFPGNLFNVVVNGFESLVIICVQTNMKIDKHNYVFNTFTGDTYINLLTN